MTCFYYFSLVQGKKYFECPPNHGIFVRQTQLTELSADPAVEEAIQSPRSGIIPPSSGASKIAGLRKPGSQSQTPQVYSTIFNILYQLNLLEFSSSRIFTDFEHISSYFSFSFTSRRMSFLLKLTHLFPMNSFCIPWKHCAPKTSIRYTKKHAPKIIIVWYNFLNVLQKFYKSSCLKYSNLFTDLSQKVV